MDYIFVYILQLQSTDGMSGSEVRKTAGTRCRLQISAYTLVSTQNESLWGRFKLLYSSSHCRTGQSQRTLIIYGANHQRAEQRGTKFVGAEFVCAPESRIDHCRGSSSRPSNKLCTSHTQVQRHADTHIHTLWIIHERGVSQSQWHAKSLTNAQHLTERQSLFYLDGGDHWCVCETVGGASVCVWVCVCCQWCTV